MSDKLDIKLNVNEIFCSIQGESSLTGFPSVFIRLFACNLNCSYCDTLYSCKGNESKRISIAKIMDIVDRFKIKRVCITGGEPLLQYEEVLPLIYELQYNKYNVSIETNGSIPLRREPFIRSYKYVMDIKCPSSGMEKFNLLSNLSMLQSNDEVKFVIGNRADYIFATNIILKYKISASTIFSPVILQDKHIANKIGNWLIEDGLHQVRLGVQLHKLINFK